VSKGDGPGSGVGQEEGEDWRENDIAPSNKQTTPPPRGRGGHRSEQERDYFFETLTRLVLTGRRGGMPRSRIWVVNCDLRQVA